MTRSRVLPVLALGAGLLLCTVGASAQPTKPRPGDGQPNGSSSGQPPGPKGPPDPPWLAEVPVVPKNAAAFVSLKVSDVLDHPDFKAMIAELKKTPDGLSGFTEMFGLAPHEIDRVTLFWPTISATGSGDPILVVTTRGAYNAARIVKALDAEPVFEGDPNDVARPGIGRGEPKGGSPPETGRGARGEPAGGSTPETGRGARGEPAGGSTPTNGKKDCAPPAPVPDHELKRPPVPAPDPNRPPGFDLKPKSPEPADSDPKPAPQKAEPVPTPKAPAGPTAPRGEPLFYRLTNGPFQAFVPIDDRTLAFLPGGFGGDAALLALCARLMQKKPNGPLAEALATSGGHTFTAGVALAPLFREVDPAHPPRVVPNAAFAAAKIATLNVDLGKTARVTLTVPFGDADAAKRAAPELEKAVKVLAAAVDQMAAPGNAPRAPRPGNEALLAAVATGLKKATGRVDGARFVATAEIDAAPAAARAVGAALRALDAELKFAIRANNLKQIVLALHNYHDANQKLPTNVYGPKGEPLLSWRVHLLPYMEQGDLYNQFKMDEAWDGPNNKKLIEKMPKVFEVIGRDAPKGQTFYQAFLTPNPDKQAPKGGPPGGPPGGMKMDDPKNPRPVGPPGRLPLAAGRTWLIEGDKVGTTFATIFDGMSNTIGVVEARTGAIWSKPDDLMFGAKLPPLGDQKADTFMAAMLDGSVRRFSTKIKPDVLRLLIDAQDGTPIPGEAFEDDIRGLDRYWNDPFGFEAARERDRDRLLEEFQLGEFHLGVATDHLNQARREAERQAAQTAETEKNVKTGGANKDDLDKARAASDETLVRVRAAEVEVKKLQERQDATERALRKGGVVPLRRSERPKE